MRLWSVQRSKINGGLKRSVEVCRFSPDRTLVRRDDPRQKRLSNLTHRDTVDPNLTFVLCRDLGPTKEGLLVDLVTVRLDLSSSRHTPPTPLRYFVWDIAFFYEKILESKSALEAKAQEREEDAGRARWFLERTGVAAVEDEFETSESDLEKLRKVFGATPVPGHFFLQDDELELYASLGEDPPFFWSSFDDFFLWASERPDARQFSEGG